MTKKGHNMENNQLKEDVKKINESKGKVEDMIKLLIKYDPAQVYEEMLKTNASFRQFVEENKHKSTQDLIYDCDLKLFQ